MFELGNIQRMAVSVVGAILLTSATVFAAAAPAEVGPSVAYASTHIGTDANG
ncbi:hypothetical protein [Sphingosinicella rhizophila]|uniref:Uncharacterized protein n=1 Tax=Sphingosinicella rhizophila TaxID=3050082 RepID=A0ABU3Q6I7_9SPHN|nr:hypothetical protein [Sphingosinicella sp. GR2756]MDT9598932.1 hypothetical protein [Sphingosinicella sp. GR2756]